MRVMLVAATVLCAGALSFADDLVPPPWRTSPPGQGTTTLQEWEFGTDKNPTGPDLVYNKYGAPLATIAGEFPLTLWKAEDFGHKGVWRLEDWIQLDIPNNPDPLAVKEIWLQITFSAAAGNDPEITTKPEFAAIETVKKTQLDDYYYHGTYHLTIKPNPDMETIFIMPRDCTLYVDQIVVDTICIPEPASLGLLAAAGLLALRRR